MYPLGLAGLVAAVLLVAPARAETLLEALTAAYQFNPRLDVARAILRATDEEVSRALAGYRPASPAVRTLHQSRHPRQRR